MAVGARNVNVKFVLGDSLFDEKRVGKGKIYT